jgi:hypothetical protein
MLAWVARAAYAFTQIIAGPLDAQGILLFIIVTITPLSVLVSNYTLQFPLIPKLFFSDNTQNDKHVKNYKIKVKVCGFLRLEFFFFYFQASQLYFTMFIMRPLNKRPPPYDALAQPTPPPAYSTFEEP